MLTTALTDARSFLFVPGCRPDRFDKALAAGADTVVLDLEDAVPPAAKTAAREAVRSWIQSHPQAAVVVRINDRRTTWFTEDCRLLAELECGAMLPKTESPSDLGDVQQNAGRDVPLLALIETATAVLHAAEICRTRGLMRVAFGSLDFARQLGIAHDDREAMMFARSQLVLATHTAGLAGPIDGVTTQLHDSGRLAEDIVWARRLGFTAKLCIHPAQVGVVNDNFGPTAEELSWARTLLVQVSSDESVNVVNGEMVDKPLLERARHILRRTHRAAPTIITQPAE